MKRFLILIFLPTTIFSQQLTGQATLPQQSRDAFYRIHLLPEITADLKPDGANARIIDDNGDEVPYLFEKASAKTIEIFREYKILKKEYRKGCCTFIIIQNDSNKVVDNFLLRIGNAEINKIASVEGSDDRKQWFAVKDRFNLTNLAGSETSELKVLNFPASQYKYYQINIDDSAAAPINITHVGYIDRSSFDPSYTKIIPEYTRVTDSAKLKQTFYRVILPGSRWIDRVDINAGGVPYFYRKGTLFEVIDKNDKVGKTKRMMNPIARFEISSEGATRLDLPDTRGKEFIIVIDNADSPSLAIESVEIYQSNRYLIAFLKKDILYRLKWSDEFAAPTYDLHHFANVIPGDAAIIIPALVDPTSDDNVEIESFWKSPLIIWTSLLVVGALLSWMSVVMIRESSSKTR